MIGDWLGAAVVGLIAGYLSGQFGIGGGMITTPAIRLFLGGSELIAVGTSLPVIIPTAITGVVEYGRRRMLDMRAGATIGLVGAAFSVVGAWCTSLVGGDVVLYVTSALICWMAIDMAHLALRSDPPEQVAVAQKKRQRSWPWLVGIGALAGALSGFLGLGGGFIVVPALVRFLGFDAKQAVGTSLVAVLLFAIPGSIVHYALGHVDLRLALGISIGVVPGSILGARVTAAAQERTVRLGFSLLLLLTGGILAANELGWL